LNRQVAREALEVLCKYHTVFLSCGPYVLKQLLARIEEKGGLYRKLLRWLKKIELDWVTFPNLRIYPPERADGKDEWWWERHGQEVDVDYIRGAAYNGNYDEHDYEGGYYDDNFYGAEDDALYWQHQAGSSADPVPNDPFGFASHYPFADPHSEPSYDVDATEHVDSKLDLLISMEVTPLFEYLATPVFSLTSITLPLYFISKPSHMNRTATRPGYTLPLKVRYWTQVCIRALLMLHGSSSSATTLQEVRIRYMPWDIWASMEPADDLHRMAARGVWYRDSDDPTGERECEGEAFRAIWAGMQERGLCKEDDRMGLNADVRFVEWSGDLDKWRVGDELSVVFTRGTDSRPSNVQISDA
jgi:hypothetical protein